METKEIYLKTLYTEGTINLLDIPNPESGETKPVCENCYIDPKEKNKVIVQSGKGTCTWVIGNNYLEDPVSIHGDFAIIGASDVKLSFFNSSNNPVEEITMSEFSFFTKYNLKGVAKAILEFTGSSSGGSITINTAEFYQTPTRKWVETTEKLDNNIVKFLRILPQNSVSTAGTINDNFGNGKLYKLQSTDKPGLTKLVINTDDYISEDKKISTTLSITNVSGESITWKEIATEDYSNPYDKNIVYYRDPNQEDIIDPDNKNGSYYAFSRYGYYNEDATRKVRYNVVWVNSLKNPEQGNIKVYSNETGSMVVVGKLINIAIT